jgi:hypothetical protein
MADAGEIAKTKLPDGIFLLPKRKPAGSRDCERK